MARLGTGLTKWVAIPSAIICPIIIFVAMCMMCKMFGKTKSIKPALECIPYILMSAVAFCVPYIICAMFLGPEFPSLIGALIALVICIVTAKKGILVPKSKLNSRRVPNGMQHGNLQQQKKQNRQKLKIKLWKVRFHR